VELLTSDYFSPQERFSRVSSPGPNKTFQFRLHELIEAARMNDWLLDLVAAARERRPKNLEIAAIAEDLGLTIAGPRLDNPTGKPLEEIIRENAKFINPAIFSEKLPLLEGQVCWIDIPGGGTGFLVGPDLVVTNAHVIERLRTGQARWQDVKCRFDYRQAIDGTTLDRKKQTEVGLDTTKWLVDRWPPSQYDWNPTLGDAGPEEIDCALLRLAEPTGDLPVGGNTADPQAQRRGWIDAKAAPPPLAAGNQVFLLQHPQGEPLQLTIGTVKEFNASGTRLRYDANSKDGSSGSPCFDADLELVALHHAV
jgi:Trypsin-like peptidase domain